MVHTRRHVTSGRIKVYVQPRASKSEVVGMHGEAVRIRLTAPPVDDAANDALIAFVAERLGIAKRCVRIVAGRSSRQKLIEIAEVTADSAVSRLLGQ